MSHRETPAAVKVMEAVDNPAGDGATTRTQAGKPGLVRLAAMELLWRRKPPIHKEINFSREPALLFLQ